MRLYAMCATILLCAMSVPLHATCVPQACQHDATPMPQAFHSDASMGQTFHKRATAVPLRATPMPLWWRIVRTIKIGDVRVRDVVHERDSTVAISSSTRGPFNSRLKVGVELDGTMRTKLKWRW